MADETRDAGLEFPINQQLLEDATRAREEWRVLRDRLSKIDQSRGQVSPIVYERVRRDYESRLQEATAGLLKRKEAVDRELAALRETRGKIASQLGDHRHRLEEIKFRNTLGEFTEEEYQGQARLEQDKIAKFETVITAVDSNIGRYEAIFKGEAELFATAEETGPAEEEISGVAEITGGTPMPHEAEPITDAKGFVVEEEAGPDYFSAPTDADKTNPELAAEGTTGRTPASGGGSDLLRRPRVVIISGTEAGAAYPIKGTLTFGRAESNTVVLRDAKVSRQHAQIQQQGNEFVLIDLNSSNGTHVNGQRVEEHVLGNGDEIQIGDFVLQFQA